MNSAIKLAIIVVVFCVGFTLGQGHYPLDFDGNGKLTGNDAKTALEQLTQKK